MLIGSTPRSAPIRSLRCRLPSTRSVGRGALAGVRAPTADIEQVRQATRRLLASVEELSDDDVAEPCALPGWSRAELLTHVARNADAHRNTVEAGARGEVADMYPGGAAQRTDAIAAGA